MLDQRTSDSIDLGTTLDSLSRNEIAYATAMLADAVSDMRADPAIGSARGRDDRRRASSP